MYKSRKRSLLRVYMKNKSARHLPKEKNKKNLERNRVCEREREKERARARKRERANGITNSLKRDCAYKRASVKQKVCSDV